MKKFKKGFMLLAFNNKQINYIKMASCCALSIKSHLKNNHITLVTDESFNWFQKNESKQELIQVFDHIIKIDHDVNNKNKNNRTHYDSPWTKFEAPFLNSKREDIYNLSPYEETIVLDVDYLIMSNYLDSIWENSYNFLINKNASNLRNQKFSNKEVSLFDGGIPMYWATIIYFKKCELSKIIFNLVKFIKENYSFYKMLYKFPGNLYRNDYAFSIAMHIINSFIETNNFSFPNKSIKTMDQKDDIIKVSNDDILFLSHDPEQQWVNNLVKIENIDVHIMNKRAFLRHIDDLCNIFLQNINIESKIE